MLSTLSVQDAERVLRLADVSVRHRLQNPAARYVKPELRGAASILWDTTEHQVVVSGPAETGKTFAALAKLNSLMWDNPGAQAAIVRKTYQSMHGSVLQTYRRILGKDTVVHSFGGEKPEWFDYPNGSRVFVGGMDNPQKVLSSERDIIYVNQVEELELGDWETLTTRATGRGGVMPYAQVYGDCNPGSSSHWILNLRYLRMLYSHHEDNPTLFTEDGAITEQGTRTMAVLDALTGTRYKRLRLGLWVGAEGMVYDQWDRSMHVLDRAQLREWGVFTEEGVLNRAAGVVREVIGSVDWGFTNPGVIQVWATDNDGRMYLIHEIYQTRQLIPWWVEKAAEVKARYGITRFHCDPAEPAYIAAFNQAGLNAVGADNEIGPGIQAVQARLPKQADGRARLYVYRGALEYRDPMLEDAHKPCGLIEEMDGYIWQRAQDGKPNKEVPLDKDNHAEDTARYAVMAKNPIGIFF